MKKTGVILIVSWMLMRSTFHSFSFDACKFIANSYFIANSIALVGLFLFLYKTVKSGIVKRLIKVSIIYAGFCLLFDILMSCGVGSHDSWYYTATSMLILSIGMLWVKFA